jgi:hypothetical protein
LGDSDDKVNAAGFSDSTIDKTVNGITYDIYTHSVVACAGNEDFIVTTACECVGILVA